MVKKNLLAFCFILIGFISSYAQSTSGTEVNNIHNDSNRVYTGIMDIDVFPKFPGDIKKYLADSIRYPEEARKKNIQGTVSVGFIIERNGCVSNISIYRSANESLNNEAIRIVSAMPKWKPAMKNGVPVRIRYVTAVVFKL